MKKIVVTMKTWQFQMVPKYTFDYFLQRCQALGAQKQLMVIVHILRHTWPRLGRCTKENSLGPQLRTKELQNSLSSQLLRARARTTINMGTCKRNTSRRWICSINFKPLETRIRKMWSWMRMTWS